MWNRLLVITLTSFFALFSCGSKSENGTRKSVKAIKQNVPKIFQNGPNQAQPKVATQKSVSVKSPKKSQTIEPPAVFEDREQKVEGNPQLYVDCLKQVKGTKYKKINPAQICKVMKIRPSCRSVQNNPVFHYEKKSKRPKIGKNILVLSLIHGDEIPSGQISYAWIERLIDLDSRNTWRVIPMVNPDGFNDKSRVNANGIDLNRNFPTIDWKSAALERWKRVKKEDPRRFPGNSANSEPETQCMVNHINDFAPDFIISIHTPLGVLDFDGPKNLNLPKFKPLPWISLGNYPGSLGRYMWKERRVPVLTIELNKELAVFNLEKFDRLQDISGTVAIQALKKTGKKKLIK